MNLLITNRVKNIVSVCAKNLCQAEILLLHLFFKNNYLYLFCQSAISIKISNLLICFCSFDFYGPILEKDNLIKFYNIVLSCLIK